MVDLLLDGFCVTSTRCALGALLFFPLDIFIIIQFLLKVK